MFKWKLQTIISVLVGIALLMVYSIAIGAAGYIVGAGVGKVQGWNSARELVSNTFPPSPSEVYSISGRVREVGDGKLVIEASPISSNPFDLQGPSIRTATIDSKTVIQELVMKSSSQIAEENAAYQQKLDEALLPYTTHPLKIGDLQKGDVITVNARTNIRDVQEFTAIEVFRTRAAQ